VPYSPDSDEIHPTRLEANRHVVAKALRPRVFKLRGGIWFPRSALATGARIRPGSLCNHRKRAGLMLSISVKHESGMHRKAMNLA